jgi:hypothetical protein
LKNRFLLCRAWTCCMWNGYNSWSCNTLTSIHWEMWWWQDSYLVLIPGDCFAACRTSSTLALLWLQGLLTFVIFGHRHSWEIPVLWCGHCRGYFSAYRCAVATLLCSASLCSNIISFTWSSEYSTFCTILWYVTCQLQWTTAAEHEQ